MSWIVEPNQRLVLSWTEGEKEKVVSYNGVDYYEMGELITVDISKDQARELLDTLLDYFGEKLEQSVLATSDEGWNTWKCGCRWNTRLSHYIPHPDCVDGAWK